MMIHKCLLDIAIKKMTEAERLSKIRNAYRDGVIGSCNGKEKEDCPFSGGSVEYVAWWLGFVDVREELPDEVVDQYLNNNTQDDD